VHCQEETDGALEASDEISLGGTFTTPQGKTGLVQQFSVSKDFDEGETVSYAGGRTFATWDITTGNDWPHVYGAVVVMAEKDDGGFAQFLQDLWAQISAKIKDAVTGLVGAAVGVAIGTALGGIIGALAGLILGFILGWIVSLIKNPDDLVGIKVQTMTLASVKKSYYDWAKLTTPGGWPFTLRYAGDGGRYGLTGCWRVAKA
jgi:hypothetical protein